MTNAEIDAAIEAIKITDQTQLARAPFSPQAKPPRASVSATNAKTACANY